MINILTLFAVSPHIVVRASTSEVAYFIVACSTMLAGCAKAFINFYNASQITTMVKYGIITSTDDTNGFTSCYIVSLGVMRHSSVRQDTEKT